MKPQYTITIEALVFGGEAIGTLPDGKKVFVWNALPGETVKIELTKNKKDYAKGKVIEVLEASEHRVAPKEDGYLSTSPWQIMTPAYENEQKVALAKGVYEGIGKLEVGDMPIHSDEAEQFGYRNKMEFSFAEDADGVVQLAFFERGGRMRLPVDGSLLADQHINSTSKHILAWVREAGIPIRSLKSLIVRSDHKQTIAALFIKDELTVSNYPELSDTFIGFKLYYSTHKSPASVATKLLYEVGPDSLTADMGGLKLQFGLLSFFQVNIPLFDAALQHIKKHIPKDNPLLDIYAGVGAIGLALADHVTKVTCIESNAEAVEFCNNNIEINGIKNASAVLAPAEKVLDHINAESTVILDPPRAGLHPDVVHHLLWALPERIVYMSCNLSTHARDLHLLEEEYTVDTLELFNFFPRTPHIEGLAVLTKK